MGAGRQVACPSCGDPLTLSPNELDILDQGGVRCSRCSHLLVGDGLFARITTGDALTQIQLTSN
jgi:hypothetical protein